jgi:Protein of unknown function (DUF1592)/Protein of unknown function (DUF1588)/Protein of unknown function (DUF1595)
VAFAIMAGCTGYIGNAGSGSSGGGGGGGGSPAVSVRPTPADGPTSFACNPKQKPAMDQLRALTNRQYFNTLNDLLTYGVGTTAAAAILNSPAVVSAVELLPANGPNVPQPLPKPTPAFPGTEAAIENATALATAFPDGGWLRADQSIQQDRVSALYEIAAALGAEIANNYLGPLVGNCALGASGATDTSCLDTFIQRFGTRALRRPITADDVTFYEGNYKLNGPDGTLANPAASGYQDVLTGFFAAPEFLYFVEHGDPTAAHSANGVYPLSAYELASRLSYQVWDTIPDAELWAHAVDGSILEPSVYEKEVSRLFSDPRAKATLDLFFTDYFQTNPKGGLLGTGGLNYHDLAALGKAPNAAAKAFAGSDLPGPNLFQDMVADAVGFADYYSWTVPGTMHDFLTGSLSFARTKDVADIYRLLPWQGEGAPPSFPPNERPGVFTRALFVSAGLDTSPILKGVFFRRYVLCDQLGPPPPAAAGKVVKIVGYETTEQATEALTGSGICASCHPLFINPLGFATESFDGLGRHRTDEILYNVDGSVAASLPVNTSVVPRVMEDDATTKTADIAALMALVEESKKPTACLTRNYFRYTFARFEDVDVDGCSLEQMRKTVDDGGHLADLWKSVVSTPAFQYRTFQ